MKKRFKIIIVLMSLSLLGIIFIQGLWIRHAIRTERANFDRSVYDALKRGIDKVESNEAFLFLDKKIKLPIPPPPPPIFQNKYFDSVVEWHSETNKHPDKETSITTAISNSGNTVIIYNDTTKGRFTSTMTYPTKTKVIINTKNFTEEKLKDLKEKEVEINITEELFYLEEHLDSIERIFVINAEKEKIVEEKLHLFQENIDKWVMEFSFNDERFEYLSRYSDINKILSEVLSNNGILLDFQFQLLKKEKDTTIVIKSVPDTNLVLPFKYKTELYPTDIFKTATYLTLDFPKLNTVIYKSVALPIIGSLIFTIIILITFGFTLYYIQKQKKISEIKSDFINNMTHEFKTPIATISLASSAIESPKVIGNHEKTSYYVDIIKKENKRMNSQVEKVLQMAQIDNHDFNLNLQNTDIHEVIDNVSQIFALRANEKGGRINTSLKAKNYKIQIDEIHFANVLNNLIDNALKYNENIPEILLETNIRNGKFILEVSDNGLGMSREVQKHVFDKFYRKPSGNIHNIKGFGLGLSYVKAIVEAHGGEVSVNSEVGNGSKFTISLKC